VTIVGILKMAHVAADAARALAHEHGVEAEVIDPRTLRPLDLDTIVESVRKTNRAVIVEEGWPHGGVGANLATLITEQIPRPETTLRLLERERVTLFRGWPDQAEALARAHRLPKGCVVAERLVVDAQEGARTGGVRGAGLVGA